MDTKRKINIYADLFFFAIFFPLVVLLLPIGKWLTYRPAFSAAFLLYLCAVYILYKKVNIPQLLLNKRYVKGLSYLLAVIATTTAFAWLLLEYYDSDIPIQAMRNRQRVQAVCFLTAIITCYSFSNSLLIELFEQAMRRKEIEDEKNKAELALYKAQINPHFLFNTLNTLYGLLITRSDKMVTSFERFINLIKYMYSNANRDYIPIREEIDYIGQYVALQSLRLNKRTQVSFTHKVENPKRLLPPMLLITFIENAFKYGMSADEPSYIRIQLRQAEETLSFTAENPILVHQSKDSKKMGIENCRKRLALLYPQRHSLLISTADNIFKVELTLQLTEE